MRAHDLVHLVSANLRRMKMRLALTSLGVVIGTSAIVLMISLGIGLQKNVTAELGDLGSASHITVMGGRILPGVEVIEPLDNQAINELRAHEHVEAVIPSVMLRTLQDVEYKKLQGYLNIQGVPMEDFKHLGFELEKGRLPRNEKEILLGAAAMNFFSEEEIRPDQLPKITDFLGEKLVLTFAEPFAEPPAGQGIAMGGELDATFQEPHKTTRRLSVVGVLAKADLMTDQSAFVTLDAALKFNGMSKRHVEYEQATIKVDSPAAAVDVEKQLMEQGYQTLSARSIQEGLNSVFLVIQVVLGALGAIAMLVASIGIANTMTMSIYERTREIGIMKAIGASNQQIKRIFLGEAAIIGILGGIGGLLVSAFGAALANLFIRSLIASQTVVSGGIAPDVQSFFDITFGLALFAIVFAAGVGLLAGVLPAVRAANLDPLTALRHE